MGTNNGPPIDKSQLDIPLKDVSISSSGNDGISLTSSASEALIQMKNSSKGCLAVVEGPKIVGIITERDFLNKGDIGVNQWSDISVQELMSSEPITLSDSALVSDVIKLMAKRNFRHVPLVDENANFKTMVSIKDLMAFVVKFFPQHVSDYGTMIEWEYLTVDNYSEEFSLHSAEKNLISGNIFMAHLSRVCDQKPLVLNKDARIGEVVEGLKGRGKGSLLLMEYETVIKGIITERDLLYKVYDQEGVTMESPAADFMTPSPHLLLTKHYLAHAINNMFHFGYRNTIVVNEDRYPECIVSLLEIFKFMAFHYYEDEISLMKKDASGNVILGD